MVSAQKEGENWLEKTGLFSLFTAQASSLRKLERFTVPSSRFLVKAIAGQKQLSSNVIAAEIWFKGRGKDALAFVQQLGWLGMMRHARSPNTLELGQLTTLRPGVLVQSSVTQNPEALASGPITQTICQRSALSVGCALYSDSNHCLNILLLHRQGTTQVFLLAVPALFILETSKSTD